LTSDYRIMLALMVSSIIATLLVSQIYRDSIYTRVLRRKNIQLWSGREAGILNQIAVSEAMQRDCEPLQEQMTIRQVREKISKSKDESYLVVDAAGSLRGVVTFREIRGVVCEEGMEDLVLVRDIAIQPEVTVRDEDSLYETLRRMGSAGLEQLPVLSARQPDRVVGMISDRDVIRAYNKALVERETGHL
jgi:CIC family chloride channel protein